MTHKPANTVSLSLSTHIFAEEKQNASEATALRRYTNQIIVIIIINTCSSTSGLPTDWLGSFCPSHSL